MTRHGLTLRDFEGDWRLTREIEDRRRHIRGVLTGEVRFSPEGTERLIVEESGNLEMSAQPLIDPTRNYVWAAAEDEVIEVLFNDGRCFHRILPDRMMPDDTHLCQRDQDIHHVTYDFRKWPIWGTILRVVGPARDYRVISYYERTD